MEDFLQGTSAAPGDAVCACDGVSVCACVCEGVCPRVCVMMCECVCVCPAFMWFLISMGFVYLTLYFYIYEDSASTRCSIDVSMLEWAAGPVNFISQYYCISVFSVFFSRFCALS